MDYIFIVIKKGIDSHIEIDEKKKIFFYLQNILLKLAHVLFQFVSQKNVMTFSFLKNKEAKLLSNVFGKSVNVYDFF